MKIQKNINSTTVILILVFSMLFWNCKVGPNFVKPVVNTPKNYNSSFSNDSAIANIAWWDLFEDKVLQDIIRTTLLNNNDLKIAALRIEQSELQMGVIRSNLYPKINYYADGGVSGNTTGAPVSGNFSPNINLSYEIDLWGKYKRLNEAALQEYLASEEAYKSLTISLVAAVANNYLVLRDIDNRIIISENMAKTWEKNLEIMQARNRAGFISGVNVNQAEIQLNEALASLKTNERLRTQTENSISVLMGVPPQSIGRGKTLQEQLFPPELPVGLPSELLSRRPDILQAERSLNAQNERIGAAEALRYPSLTLSANIGAQIASSSFGFGALTAQLLGPIFNAKANKLNVEIEINRSKQLLEDYEKTFLIALQEVEDAMISVEKYKEEFEIRSSQVASAENALELSWVRFDSGLTDYLEILDLQRSQFSSNLKASSALQLQLTSTVNLYKALGGGWSPQNNTN